MIAIGRGVADKDSLGVAAIGRSDQILVSIKVDVGLSAVVRAFVGRSDSFCYRDIGELPITVIAVQLAGIVFSAEVRQETQTQCQKRCISNLSKNFSLIRI